MMMDQLFTATAFTGRTKIGTLEPCGDPVLQTVLAQLPAGGEKGIVRVRFADALPVEKAAACASALGMAPALDGDAFLLETTADGATVYAATILGRQYGAYSLLQQWQNSGDVAVGWAYAAPLCPFRGLKVYLPAPDDLESFYHTVEMLCYYRHNTIIIEVGGAMEYKKHPEIATAWVEYCKEMNRYPQRADEVQHMFDWDKNSIHFENGGGQVLTQDTVRQLVEHCKARGLDVIPEVPCLSHADYLLNPHPELAERAEDPYPDCYCPSNPASYELLFDVLDEVTEVFRPSVVQIGHDEYYSIGLCPRCKGKDAADIFAEDVNKIAAYLRGKGIRTMLWAEKLLNAISRNGTCYGGSELRLRGEDGSVRIARPATWRAIEKVDKDIIAQHWYWGIREGFDDEFHKNGIEMVYGNLDIHRFVDWSRRLAAGAKGGTISNWSSLQSDTLQRNIVYLGLVYLTYVFWQPAYADADYEKVIELCFDELYHYHYRDLMARPHFEIVHTTTVDRPYLFISSLPLQNEKDTIGSYEIEYSDGQIHSIPVIYGLNVAHSKRDWSRQFGAGVGITASDTEAYKVDASLLSLSYSTRPIRQGEQTAFRMLAPNPHPGVGITAVGVKKREDAGEGDIILIEFTAKN